MTNAEILRLPPHSVEAEQGVLGVLLNNNSAYDQVADILQSNDFYRHDHKIIYEKIIQTIEANKPADVITIFEALKDEEFGGLSYLGALAKNSPASENSRTYAESIKNKRIARDLIAAAERMHELAYMNGDISGRLEEAQSLLSNLHDGSISDDPVLIHDVLNEVIKEIDNGFHSKGDMTGLSTGLMDIDNKTSGFQNGDLIIIAGRPSMGKTALALQIAQTVGMDRKSVLVFSLEMNDKALVQRCLSNVGRIPSSVLRTGKLKDDDWVRLTKAVGDLHDLKIFIDQSSSPTASQMRAKARRLKRKSGLDLIIIDYLQLMSSGDRRSNVNRNEEISFMTRSLKLMAQELNIPVVVLSQLSRKVEERADKRPIMSDLRESGAIEQDADVIMFVYRDEYYSKEKCQNPGVAEIILAKQRMGETGEVYLSWSGQYCRFDNHAGHYRTEKVKEFSRKRGFNE